MLDSFLQVLYRKLIFLLTAFSVRFRFSGRGSESAFRFLEALFPRLDFSLVQHSDTTFWFSSFERSLSYRNKKKIYFNNCTIKQHVIYVREFYPILFSSLPFPQYERQSEPKLHDKVFFFAANKKWRQY